MIFIWVGLSWMEVEFEIPILAGDDIQEILLGSEWLRIFDLIAKYKEGVLSLGRSPL